ncbi:uncharacterized protein E0L32_003668 [Thyridium curvatum]|uniref:Protein phosphatase n=1 Tax=Thyridium curvatum TaxID=1093900 RepID=A0A507BA52_9PEZI|nr:uncharacterized protein E0L32_003668 [Thyridium curvatum]TPX16727.1 hypothetical protein E0L32_003668 [Thyridium curvatum]
MRALALWTNHSFEVYNCQSPESRNESEPPAMLDLLGWARLGGFSTTLRPMPLGASKQQLGRRWLSSSSTSAPSPATSSSSKFSYDIAASYIAKDHPYDPSTHVFHFNPYNRLQQTRKKHLRPESGQDAFFVSRIGDTGAVALGVADGVGGWMDSGVDPADFSHSFCDYMASVAYDHGRAPGSQGQTLTARNLMQKGYETVCSDRSIPAGGSTAIVGILTPDGLLEVANLGDSGFIQLRLNAVHAFSDPQIHAFNTPFQLSVIPPSVMARMAAFGGAQLSDLPKDAEVTHHGVRHGDVLVFASDGLWDNLFNQDILRIVSRAMIRTGAWRDTDAGIRVAPDLEPLTSTEAAASAAADGHKARPLGTLQSRIATEITAAAKAASVSTKLDGPFAKEVKKFYPLDTWHGGKVDDICVVVAVVSEKTPQPPPVKSRL